MHYFVGKFRTSSKIAEVLNSFHPTTYYEPFCGGLWVTVKVVADRYILSDNNQALITLYQSLANGWVPPDEVSESDYQWYRLTQDPTDPMTAFVGIGCSFSAKWFGGYARGHANKGYAHTAKRSLKAKLDVLSRRRVSYSYTDFKCIVPTTGSLIYCDPPYLNTTNGYSSSAIEFWETMRMWSESCTVVISEYQAPDDFICVAEFPTMAEIRGKTGRDPRIERLFMTL